MAIYQYVAENGPVVPFQGLFEAIQEAGFKTITLAVRLKQSPIIRKVKHGLYALVGAAYTDDDITYAESTIQEVDGNNLLTYNPDGTITYLFNTGPWLLYSGVINAPELHPFSGTWEMKVGGKIVIKKDRIWGLNSAVDALSPRLGERLAIHLDTWNQTAIVERAGTDDEAVS